MTNSDEVILLSRFKYDLFGLNISVLKEVYFNDTNRTKNLNSFRSLISSKDHKYYLNNYITNKVLSIIGESDFISKLTREEQLEVINLIRIIIKNDKTEKVGEQEFLNYQNKIINEYYALCNIFLDYNFNINYNLLRLLARILEDYPDLLRINPSFLKKYMEVNNIQQNNGFKKIKCYFYRQYLVLKNNKTTRNLVIR